MEDLTRCVALLPLTAQPNALMKQPCVYMLASKPNGTLYIGVTSNLAGRVWQHKNDLLDGFTKKYHVHQLVWYEVCDTMDSAILREKQLKAVSRARKLQLLTRPYI